MNEVGAKVNLRQGTVSILIERIGRSAVAMIEEVGSGAVLIGESIYLLLFGARERQPVRPAAVIQQMMEIGVRAIPIVSMMAATIGVMLAIQGIHTLKIFGAETHVTIGIAFSIVREFGPLITGIIVAGRSGSALAARLGTMTINQEIDALRVMGINPVRYLVVPALLAMLIMLPALTMLANLVGLGAAGLYVQADLGVSLAAYFDAVREILSVDDLMHGLGKSCLFAVLIAVIGVVNGASVQGGAEGVGTVTTRSVVQAISAIVLTDMLFAFVATR
jgi:phospholipid/cholesterol/gamma-HCH transport system permease protein